MYAQNVCASVSAFLVSEPNPWVDMEQGAQNFSLSSHSIVGKLLCIALPFSSLVCLYRERWGKGARVRTHVRAREIV